MYRLIFIPFLLLANEVYSEVVAFDQTPKYALEQVKALAIKGVIEARDRALEVVVQSETANYAPYASVLALTKAHKSISGINTGDWVWLLIVQNQAASDLYPAPDKLIWVAAKNGKVVEL